MLEVRKIYVPACDTCKSLTQQWEEAERILFEIESAILAARHICDALEYEAARSIAGIEHGGAEREVAIPTVSLIMPVQFVPA